MTAAEGIQDPSVVRRYGTLLAIAESVATHRELPDLLHDLISRLRQVEGFDYLEFALHDSNRSVLRHQWITSESATPLEDISLEGNAAGEVFRSQEPLVIADTTQDPRFGSLEGIPPEIRSIYFCPLQTARGCFGVVGFGSKSVNAWTQSACEFLQGVANLFALKADEEISRNREREYEDKLSWQREHCLLMLDINRLLFSELDPQGLFAAVSQSIRRLIRHDFAFLVLQETGT